MFTQSADGATTARACVSIAAFALSGLIACETCSCSASGAALPGTAWELNGSTATPVAPAIPAQHRSTKQIAHAQSTAPPHASQQPTVASRDQSAPEKSPQPLPDADPRMVTLARLDKHVTVNWQDVSLQDAFAYLRDTTGADVMVLWIDEDNPTIGLRPDRRISLAATNQGLIDVLEKILERADTRAKGDGSTWQISDTGTLQIGPRERLNKWTRTYAYDVADVLLPAIDMFDPDDALLQHGIQPTGPVKTATSLPHRRLAAGMHDERAYPVRAEELRQIIVQTCEPAAWVENGGDAATILLHTVSKAFVVRAPDYVHRAIDGYRPTRTKGTRTFDREGTTSPAAKPAASPSSQSD
ncbi:MAG TPA: hypothetical protein VHN77_05585 [Phycisphaerales bacterium]|nr:hypothetical protein [Phycisphaerales bacterium]